MMTSPTRLMMMMRTVVIQHSDVLFALVVGYDDGFFVSVVPFMMVGALLEVVEGGVVGCVWGDDYGV